jgi:hypothetical protein
VALTRTESSSETLVVYSAPEETWQAVRSAFEAVGKIKTVDESFRRVVGRIFSGGGRMNPATVTATVQPEPDERCRIDIQATAQEALIKQHTAPRAISRLLEELTRSGQLLTTPPRRHARLSVVR